MEQSYELIINHGSSRPFERILLDRKDYLREVSRLINEPRKVFLGLGDFLEIGDYSTLMDNIFFDTEGIEFENILDSDNRRLALEGDIPYSFFKLAVYFPDLLLKDVPVSCISAIGEKSRLFPGAESFIASIKRYNPVVLTAMPYEVAIEFVRRVGLNERNLIATEYLKKKRGEMEVYAGGISRFISGDRKSLEIEKYLNEHGLKEDDVVYVGRGEAGIKTFFTVNSIAFNPFDNIIPQARISLYGSSLVSLKVLFNFDGRLDDDVTSEEFIPFIPSLIVYSTVRDKSPELIEYEKIHRNYQNNVIGQIVEHSGESYDSVAREIEVAFAGSSVNISQVKEMVTERIGRYRSDPTELVKQIYTIARERYKSFCTSGTPSS